MTQLCPVFERLLTQSICQIASGFRTFTVHIGHINQEHTVLTSWFILVTGDSSRTGRGLPSGEVLDGSDVPKVKPSSESGVSDRVLFQTSSFCSSSFSDRNKTRLTPEVWIEGLVKG